MHLGSGSGFRVSGFRGLGFRVSGLGFNYRVFFQVLLQSRA